MNIADENLEIEIKLQLGNFTDYLKLIGFLGNIDAEDHQENCFFDSEDHQLATAGWALRVRVSDGKGLVTVKGMPSESSAAVVRQEIEAAITRSAALDIVHLETDILDLSIEPIAFIKEKFPGIKLAKLINFKTVRQQKNYKIGDYHYVLEIDKTEFADGSVDYELEIELPDTGRVMTVEDSMRKLFNSLAIPFQRQTESKFVRALRHARFM